MEKHTLEIIIRNLRDFVDEETDQTVHQLIYEVEDEKTIRTLREKLKLIEKISKIISN